MSYVSLGCKVAKTGERLITGLISGSLGDGRLRTAGLLTLSPVETCFRKAHIS